MTFAYTTKQPTIDGFYWCKCRGRLSGVVYETVVRVSNNGKNVFWDGDNFNMNNHDFLEWSNNPIPKPM